MQAGLGNQRDLVGRFFMEHPHVNGFGEAVLADLQRMPPLYRQRLTIERRPAQAAFSPSINFLRTNRLLNANFMLGLAGHYKAGTPTYLNAQKTASHRDMLRAARPFLIDQHAPTAEALTSDGVWLGMGSACEQIPNPDSRVTLADEKDALGLRKIRLDWRLTEQDRRSLLQHMHSLALELGALGLGRMQLDIEDNGIWPTIVNGGSHHMGTTRMSENPQSGVVDRNCRVHGLDNLYIAGSSVFPTSGAANPTLTIVALALRLADHLRNLKA
jgi:choline dehydrogenase-like flavoprotein